MMRYEKNQLPFLGFEPTPLNFQRQMFYSPFHNFIFFYLVGPPHKKFASAHPELMS